MESRKILYIDDESQEFTALASACKQYFSIQDELTPSIDKGVVTYQLGSNAIICVKNSSEALAQITREQFDIVFIDFKLSGEEGDEVGKETYKRNSDIHKKIIYQVMLTAHHYTMINTLRAGVFRDFISKPLNDQAAFAGVFARFEAFRKIDIENTRLKEEVKQNKTIIASLREFKINLDDYKDDKSPLKGNSQAMKEIRFFISQYAKTEYPILLLGETGTGKEIIAREIFNQATVLKDTYHIVNCAAFPDDLIESELFGYVKGAFTGAISEKKGAFEIANNGTLFLDEFGDLSEKAQVKVLRAIETGEFIKLGDNRITNVNVRVICATSQKINELAGENNFRIDLFYRVGGLFPEIIPLRERREDIWDIYESLSQINCLTYEAKRTIAETDYSWPGNVRELRNFIKHVAAIFYNNQERISDKQISSLLELWKTRQPISEWSSLYPKFHKIGKNDDKNKSIDTSLNQNYYRNYSSYKNEQIKDVETRLRLYNTAMKDGEVLITNLNEIARKSKEIHDNDILMNQYGFAKIRRGLSQHGNTVGEFFRSQQFKIAAIVDQFENEFKNVFELDLYKEHIKSIREGNK
jgi:two-component system, NtrC family, nitrogen regulation response regulator NtrX